MIVKVAVTGINAQSMLKPRAGSYSLASRKNKVFVPIKKSSSWLSSAGSD